MTKAVGKKFELLQVNHILIRKTIHLSFNSTVTTLLIFILYFQESLNKSVSHDDDDEDDLEIGAEEVCATGVDTQVCF